MSILMDNIAATVSRETMQRLETYVALLTKWTRAINLVGKSTEQEIWHRHIGDSWQLISLIPSVSNLADLGSGGGLPGMVIAITRPEINCDLIEQDQRKAAFLQECVAQLKLTNTRIINQNINDVSHQYNCITARALASLSELCALAYPRLEKGAICLFPKGQNFAIEVEEAQQHWTFQHQCTPSKTDEKAAIIQIAELSPREGNR